MASGSKSVNATFTTAGVVCDVIKFSWWENSQSVANNTTNVGWKLELISYKYGYISSSANKNWSVTVNGQKYSGTNKVGISANSTKTLASGTTTITHNSNGAKSFSYSFTQDLKINFNTYVGTISGSGSGTLTTISRASQPTLSSQNVYFGDTITINTNRASSSFTHTVRYEFGSLSGTIGTGVETSVSWTIPMSLINAIPNSREGSGRVFVDTYNGSTLIGTKYSGFTATVDINDASPSLTMTLEDTTSVYSTYGAYVQGLSKIKATATATTAYGSSVARRSITIDGKTYNSHNVTTDFLVNSGDSIVYADVYDSRGIGITIMEQISILPYSRPAVTKLTVHRCNSDGTANDQGTYIKVVFSAKITSLNSQNTATYTLKYKKTSASSWTSKSGLASGYTVTDASYIFAADEDSSYDVSVTATDRHNTTTRSTSASTAFTLMNFKASGTGVAFGKLSERAKAVEIALDLYDKYDTPIGNGKASYTGSGDNAIDPNTTIEHLILTNINVPVSSTWFYVKTEFYSKATTGNRFQMAMPYTATSAGIHFRVYYSGAWSAWVSL